MASMRSHRPIRLALAAVLISGVVAGCTSARDAARSPTASPVFPIRTPSAGPSGGQEDETGERATERCTITSVAMIRRHFGARGIAETVGTTGIGNPTCRFVVQSSNLGVGGVVSVTLTPRSSTSELAAAAHAVPGATAVPGVGDRAFYTASPASILFVRAGKRVTVRADLHVPASPQPEPRKLRTDLIGVARSIVAQL